MSPHQSKTGVYVFFCISRKVNSCFFCVYFVYFLLCCLLLLLSLSFFASLADLSLSSSLSLFFFFFSSSASAAWPLCRARANLCRRRSVAFCPHFQKGGEMHTLKRTHPESPHAMQYWEHRRRWPQQRVRDAFHSDAVADFFEWEARARGTWHLAA